jgi:hypothetical protein
MALPPFQTALERFPDHAKAIGITSVEIANLDIFLSWLFAAILRLPIDVGSAIFLTPNSATARLEMLETAINEMINESTKRKDVYS